MDEQSVFGAVILLAIMAVVYIGIGFILGWVLL